MGNGSLCAELLNHGAATFVHCDIVTTGLERLSAVSKRALVVGQVFATGSDLAGRLFSTVSGVSERALSKQSCAEDAGELHDEPKEAETREDESVGGGCEFSGQRPGRFISLPWCRPPVTENRDNDSMEQNPPGKGPGMCAWINLLHNAGRSLPPLPQAYARHGLR